MTTSGETNRRAAALVTGAGGGIGSQGRLTLARAGHPVAAIDRDRDLAGETAELVRAEGAAAWSGGVDVTSWEALVAGVAAGERALGDLEIFVQCAGIEGRCAPLVDYPEEAF